MNPLARYAPFPLMLPVLAQSSGPTANDWTNLALEKGGTLAVLAFMFWIFKGYYDKAMVRDAERSGEVKDMLTQVITIATNQQALENSMRGVIERNTTATETNTQLMKQVADKLHKA
jgi:hypothetical protein